MSELGLHVVVLLRDPSELFGEFLVALLVAGVGLLVTLDETKSRGNGKSENTGIKITLVCLWTNQPRTLLYNNSVVRVTRQAYTGAPSSLGCRDRFKGWCFSVIGMSKSIRSMRTSHGSYLSKLAPRSGVPCSLRDTPIDVTNPHRHNSTNPPPPPPGHKPPPL